MILMNLFSVFDHSSYFGLLINWIIVLMILMFFPLKYYCFRSSWHSLFKSFPEHIEKMFAELPGSSK